MHLVYKNDLLKSLVGCSFILPLVAIPFPRQGLQGVLELWLPLTWIHLSFSSDFLSLRQCAYSVRHFSLEI